MRPPRLNSEELGGIGIIAIPGVSLLGMALARGGAFDGMGDLGGLGPVVAGVGVFALGAGALVAKSRTGGGSAQRTFRVHHDAGEYKIAARHEAGHIAMAEQEGCTVVGARIFGDGTGWTEYREPWGGLDAVGAGAIDVAGEVASSTSSGCGSDQHQFNSLLKGVGWSNRGYVKRKSYAWARRTVGPGLLGGAPSQVAKYERRLLSKGRL